MCFGVLYVCVGLIFYGFLSAFMSTRKDDTTLWIWFAIQASFAIFLCTAIATATNQDVMAGSDDVENPMSESKTE